MSPSRSSSGLFLPAFILALGLAFGAFMLAGPLRAYVKSRQVITVKGYAERNVESDFGLWSATITTRGALISDAAAQMDKDTGTATKFLLAQGMAPNTISLADLTTTELIKTDKNSDSSTGELEGYKLDREVSVASTDLDRVAKLAETGPELLRDGLEVNFTPTQYYCTKLAELKVTMLGEAMKDARRRAEQIAGNSGRSIGSVRSASQGVFQITAVYQNETSDEGSLDSNSRQKCIRAVVTAEFELQ